MVAVLDREPAVPAPGGVQFADGAVSWLTDNVTKGVSRAPTVTVHASAAWSAAHDGEDRDELAAALLEQARPWLGSARPDAVVLRRWRYARPRHPHERRAVAICADPPLVLAGDAFRGPKVEGAVLSGLAAAGLVRPDEPGPGA
jgi:hypothetical protein